MSVTFGFYNSISGDRKYNASDMSAIFNGIINDGVFMSIGGKLMASAAGGMNVTVDTGRAWFNGTWTNNDAGIVLAVPTSELILNRMDSIVLEVNAQDATRANSIKIIKGIPASSPVAPVLTKGALLNQYTLCNIYVKAGVTSITQADIVNKVGTSECPFVTGILSTINTDVLLTQWDSEFDIWFNNIKGQLSGDVATNLQDQINTLNQTTLKTGSLTWNNLQGL